jgi:hypothetical protein
MLLKTSSSGGENDAEKEVGQCSKGFAKELVTSS